MLCSECGSKQYYLVIKNVVCTTLFLSSDFTIYKGEDHLSKQKLDIYRLFKAINRFN